MVVRRQVAVHRSASQSTSDTIEAARREAQKWRKVCEDMQQRVAKTSPDAALDPTRLISELQNLQKELEDAIANRDAVQKDLRIASAYGASLMAEKDLLAAEKEDLGQQIDGLKAKLEERAEEVEQLNAANRRLLETLEDADGSMGGLTTGLQVRVRGAVCEGRDHKQRARERERRREGGRKRNGGKEGREECERKS